MKKVPLKFGAGLRAVLGNRRVQAAQMTIKPGGAEGGPRNRHRASDQWLLVIAGRGIAMVEGRHYPLNTHTLLLIEHGEQHEIRNVGKTALRTLNFYSPPGYTKGGHEKSAARP